MSTVTYECPHCGKDTFTSQRGLTQHQQRSALCATRIRMADIQYSGYHTANEGMLYTEINMTSAKRSTPVNEERGKLRPNSWAKRKDRSINQEPAFILAN